MKTNIKFSVLICTLALMLSACNSEKKTSGNGAASTVQTEDSFITITGKPSENNQTDSYDEAYKTNISLPSPSENLIASGTSNNVNWKIREDGLLVVTGYGDWEHCSENNYLGPWMRNASKIVAAEIHLTGTTNADSMFRGCTNLTTIDLKDFDTGNVTSMSGMFENCYNLTSIDLSDMDTGNVTEMNCMFENCNSLTSLDLSGFDTSNVTSMARMFFNCIAVKNLDLSNFNTSNVTNMDDMFYGCSSLESLDVSSFDTGNVTILGGMFYNCVSLKEIDVSGFDTSSSKEFVCVFSDCKSLKYLDLSLFNFGSNKAGNRDLLEGCSGLTEVKAPIDFGNDKFYIPLPGTFYDVETGQDCNCITSAYAGHTLKRK